MILKRAKRRPSKLARREALVGWLFALPWIIGFLLFTAGPMLFSLYTSFTDYNILRAPEWVGLDNYRNIFLNDGYFWKSLENTFWMVGVKTPIVIVLALAIAILLNLNLPGSSAARDHYLFAQRALGRRGHLFVAVDSRAQRAP